MAVCFPAEDLQRALHTFQSGLRRRNGLQESSFKFATTFLIISGHLKQKGEALVKMILGLQMLRTTWGRVDLDCCDALQGAAWLKEMLRVKAILGLSSFLFDSKLRLFSVIYFDFRKRPKRTAKRQMLYLMSGLS